MTRVTDPGVRPEASLNSPSTEPSPAAVATAPSAGAPRPAFESMAARLQLVAGPAGGSTLQLPAPGLLHRAQAASPELDLGDALEEARRLAEELGREVSVVARRIVRLVRDERFGSTYLSTDGVLRLRDDVRWSLSLEDQLAPVLGEDDADALRDAALDELERIRRPRVMVGDTEPTEAGAEHYGRMTAALEALTSMGVDPVASGALAEAFSLAGRTDRPMGQFLEARLAYTVARGTEASAEPFSARIEEAVEVARAARLDFDPRALTGAYLDMLNQNVAPNVVSQSLFALGDETGIALDALYVGFLAERENSSIKWGSLWRTQQRARRIVEENPELSPLEQTRAFLEDSEAPAMSGRIEAIVVGEERVPPYEHLYPTGG